MPEVLYRDDTHKFSVYRLRDIPDGVPRSGWKQIGGDMASFWSYRANASGAHLRKDFSKFNNFGDFGREVVNSLNVCCAVLDEHAGPLLEKPKFAVGMRVKPTERFWTGDLRPGVVMEISGNGYLRIRQDGRGELGSAFYAPDIWEPEPIVNVTIKVVKPADIPTEDSHRELTKHLGAQRGEHVGCKSWPSHASATWSAHLRFLVERSEKERRDREPSVLMPYDED